MLQAILTVFMAMAFVLVGWLLTVGALAGLGLLVVAPARRSDLPVGCLLLAPWAGLALVSGVLQVLHFFLPIGPTVGLALVAGGWLVMALRLASLGRLAASVASRPKIVLLLAAVAALFIAHRATDQLGGDSGLYHLQVIRWNQAYPVVTGLGNLHDRYAFNNSSLLVFAALDHGPGLGRANHLLNSLLICLILLQGLWGISRLRDPRRASRAVGAYSACGLIFALQMANHSMVSSYSTDVMPAGLCFVAGSLLLSRLLGAGEARRGVRDLLICLLLLAAAVSAKLTAAMFALSAGLICLALLWRIRPGRSPRRGARLLAATGIGLAFVGPWVARTALLSGYLVYPSGIGPLDVDWRIPRRIQQDHMQYIRTFEPWRQNLGSPKAWMGLADRLQRDIIVPAGLAGSGILLLGWLGRTGRAKPSLFPPAAWLVAGAALAGIGLWLYVSPQRRMGFYLFWVLEGVVAACFAASLPRPRGRQYTALAVMIALLAIGNIKKFFHPPGPDMGLYPSPTVRLETYTTRSGLELLVPPEGECFDAPILSTGFPKPGLELRDPEDISAGFRIRRPTD